MSERIFIMPSTQRAGDKNTVKVTRKRVTTVYLRTGSNPEPGIVQWRKVSLVSQLLDIREVREKGVDYAMQRENARVRLRYRCQMKKRDNDE